MTEFNENTCGHDNSGKQSDTPNSTAPPTNGMEQQPHLADPHAEQFAQLPPAPTKNGANPVTIIFTVITAVCLLSIPAGGGVGQLALLSPVFGAVALVSGCIDVARRLGNRNGAKPEYDSIWVVIPALIAGSIALFIGFLVLAFVASGGDSPS